MVTQINTNKDWRIWIAILLFAIAGTVVFVKSFAAKPDKKVQISEGLEVQTRKNQPVSDPLAGEDY